MSDLAAEMRANEIRVRGMVSRRRWHGDAFR
jgi:hypothetical protein